MLEDIEKVLILQDCDRKLLRAREELSRVEPEREEVNNRAQSAQTGLDAAKHKVKTLESARKDLELEVEGKKQQIEKYSVQQFQTKKNEEFRALAHEIEACKGVIFKLEDRQLELMEQIEQAQKEVASATRVLAESRKVHDGLIQNLAAREESLRKETALLETRRTELASTVEENVLARYERLLRHKGENVVVGIQHGVCGGCHMKLPAQIVVSCQGRQELVACPNCGRIVYYTRDMDLAIVD
jgi:predicted  nucleic acid-binding Zn-ribbon protein